MKAKAVFTIGQRLAAIACVAATISGQQSAQATSFPADGPRNDPAIGSMGVVKISVVPKFVPAMLNYPNFFSAGPGGPRLYSPVLNDNNTTIIGRSAVHTNGNIPAAGVPVGAALTLTKYSDYSDVPPDFIIPAGSAREVFTEVVNMVLRTTGANGCCSNQAGGLECYRDPRFPSPIPPGIAMVKAGPASGAAPVLPRSVGQVQSHNPPTAASDDFPARSFFDIFVEVELPPGGSFFPGALLRNPTPMVVTNQALDAFPPTVIYIHGGTTAAPLAFKNPGNANGVNWVAGEVFGYLVLAGHGTKLDCSNPAVVQAFVETVLGPPNNEKVGLPLPTTGLHPIPTVSQWGLIILGLLVLSIGTAFILRRRVPAAA